jgi:alpha-glucosidase
MLLTLRGTPFLYYGEELGLPNTQLRRSQIVDPPGRRYWPFYKGRDPERCPMPWDSRPHGGFTTGRPWLPVDPSFPERNAAAQRRDPESVFSFYRSLLRLRRASPALRRGVFRPLTAHPGSALVYLRETSQQRVLVALNFTPRPQVVRVDEDLNASEWALALSSLPHPRSSVAGTEVTLGPHEAAIFKRS